MHLFTSTLFSRSQFYKVSFSLGIAISLIFASLFLMNIPAQAIAPGHGCALDPPSPVSGNPVQPPAQAGIIFINEVLSNPASNWNCSSPPGTFPPHSNSWIELYNPNSDPLDLYSVHTQISIDSGTNWYHFPVGTAIAPYGFLVLFPEEKLPPVSSWNVILTMGSTFIFSFRLTTSTRTLAGAL